MLNDNYQKKCPCHSGLFFTDCCLKFLDHKELPSTALELMKSRYVAFCVHDIGYIKNTMRGKASTINSDINDQNICDEINYINLEIISTRKGLASDLEGEVEFKATYIQQGRYNILHERSFFVKQKSKWYYVSGDIL